MNNVMVDRGEIVIRENLAEQLVRFRAIYPLHTLDVGGSHWEYYIGGAGSQAVLILPGLLGIGEMSFPHMIELAKHYRVVVPSYPFSAETVDALLAGLIAILDTENLRTVHVLGGSYGGMVAQRLVRKHPERVANLILAHTGGPLPERAAKNSKLISLLRWLPMSLLRWMLKASTRKSLEDAPLQRSFWEGYSNEVIARLKRDDLLARYQVAVDFDLSSHFTPNDLDGWPGRVLILEGDNDPIADAPAREALKELHPGAAVYTFHGTGHVASIAKVEEYIAAIESFIVDD